LSVEIQIFLNEKFTSSFTSLGLLKHRYYPKKIALTA